MDLFVQCKVSMYCIGNIFYKDISNSVYVCASTGQKELKSVKQKMEDLARLVTIARWNYQQFGGSFPAPESERYGFRTSIVISCHQDKNSEKYLQLYSVRSQMFVAQHFNCKNRGLDETKKLLWYEKLRQAEVEVEITACRKKITAMNEKLKKKSQILMSVCTNKTLCMPECLP